VATAEYAVQTVRYPQRKMPTGSSGREVFFRRWFTLRKARIIGAADGTIMATIITAHITERRRTATMSHGIIMRGISISTIAAFE
jgi:hypothetical protein